MSDRLVAAAERVISRLGEAWYYDDESLSPIAELAGPALSNVLKQVARVSRIRVDPKPDDVRFEDRSLARLKPVSCSPPERCSIGAEHTSLGWEPVFIRDCPRSNVSKLQREMLKCWGTILHPRLARPRRIDAVGDQLAIACDRISGVSLDQLGPLPAPLALAILADARSSLSVLHAEGMTHGALRPRRVRVTPSGHVSLCYGADAEQTTASEDHARLASVILASAFDDGLLFEILASGDTGACTVACDRIVELQPNLDDLAVAALRSDGRIDSIHPALVRAGMRDAALAVLAVATEEVAA
jgi:hypothetical protein